MLHAGNQAVLEVEPTLEQHASEYIQNAEKRLNILLVEDINSDAMLTTIALEATKIPFTLSKIKRGTEVVSRIRMTQRVCPLDLPDLILLDLGLPGMDGFEILAELSQMAAVIRAIPIVILTGHEHFEYIQSTYPLCVLAYINKPCNSLEMQEVLTRVRNGK